MLQDWMKRKIGRRVCTGAKEGRKSPYQGFGSEEN
jgi:hypothetical protein